MEKSFPGRYSNSWPIFDSKTVPARYQGRKEDMFSSCQTPSNPILGAILDNPVRSVIPANSHRYESSEGVVKDFSNSEGLSKNSTQKEESTDIMYRISCNSCYQFYLRQTGWQLKNRIHEHQLVVKWHDNLKSQVHWQQTTLVWLRWSQIHRPCQNPSGTQIYQSLIFCQQIHQQTHWLRSRIWTNKEANYQIHQSVTEPTPSPHQLNFVLHSNQSEVTRTSLANPPALLFNLGIQPFLWFNQSPTNNTGPI